MKKQLLTSLALMSCLLPTALAQIDSYAPSDEDYWTVPVRRHGFEYGLEASKAFGQTPLWGGDVLLGYKFNPKISAAFGIGFGMGLLKVDDGQSWRTTYEQQIIPPGVIVGLGSSEETSRVADGRDDANESFMVLSLRGTYRFTDKRFSPIASVDLAYRMNTDSHEDKWGVGDPSEASYNKNLFVVTPAIGASLRTTNNSYLELRVGYHITGKTADGFTNTGETGSQTTQRVVWREEYKSIAGSGLMVGLSWKHTFGYTPQHILDRRKEQSASRSQKWATGLGIAGGILSIGATAATLFGSKHSSSASSADESAATPTSKKSGHKNYQASYDVWAKHAAWVYKRVMSGSTNSKVQHQNRSDFRHAQLKMRQIHLRAKAAGVSIRISEYENINL